MVADRYSAPEPDIAIVHGQLRDYVTRHPEGRDVRILVELAQTSHANDRRKIAIYAAAGVQEYWLVDLRARRIEVYGRPQPDGAYLDRRIYSDSEAIDVAGHRLSVASLLP